MVSPKVYGDTGRQTGSVTDSGGTVARVLPLRRSVYHKEGTWAWEVEEKYGHKSFLRRVLNV